ncbi:MAG: nucleotidyltransferase family protein [Candidatus Omnitrophica bacterium]|nr:nucleotidyltransferase family protein [Candidatus Omnitrophota bacterium]
MTVIILCAGYATRLAPLTDSCPKSLLPLAGKPLLNYLIEKVQKIPGLDRIILVSNAKFFDVFCAWQKKFYPKETMDVLNDGSTANENRLGAIRDIEFAMNQKNISDDCLILAGDNFFTFDLTQFTKTARSKSPSATLAVYDVQDLHLATRYGLVSCDSAGKITAFFEKPKEPTTTLASTGVYFFPAESLKMLRKYMEDHQNPDAPGHYVHWLIGHSEVFAFPFCGTWYDIGDFESYRKADQEIQQFLSKR